MQQVRDANCRHLAAVVDHFADQATGRLCIVMEKYGQSLEGLLRGGQRPTARAVWGWGEDMARGLAVLHAAGIIHTDLELRNVLLDSEGRAVLGDFGSSLFINVATSGELQPSVTGLKMDEHSAMWPPEVRRAFAKVVPHVGWDEQGVTVLAEALVEARLSPKADVWALGCILLQLLLGPTRHLAPEMADHWAAMGRSCRERDLRRELETGLGASEEGGLEGACAERLVALIARVLTLDPSLRPSAAELLPAPTNPDLPCVGSRVVARPALLQRLKQAVLAPAARAVAVTSQPMNKRKVWGMGGVGKTTLAQMLINDEDIGARFRDGVAWVVLGNESPSLAGRQEDVHLQLIGHRPEPPFKDHKQGTGVLRRALTGRACLVVVDDVWDKSHTEAFDCLGPEGVLLVTSRFDGVLSTPPEACVKVDIIDPRDGAIAVAMLHSHAREEAGDGEGVVEGKGQAPAEGREEEEEEEEKEVRAVLGRCGGVPLAIAIAGSLKRILSGTWGEVLAAMEQSGGGALELEGWSEQYQYEGLWKALRASVTQLKASHRPDDYARLLWYGAFMEDTWVPLEIIRRVWGMDDLRTKGVLRSLAGRSLIELDMEGGWRSKAHDLLRDFLQGEAREAIGEEGVRGMHYAIIRQGMQACERVSSDVVPYFGYHGLSRHLEQSGERMVRTRLPAELKAALVY
jgi:hypothetical protein